MLSQRSLRLSSILFLLLFFILLCSSYFRYSLFQVTYPFLGPRDGHGQLTLLPLPPRILCGSAGHYPHPPHPGASVILLLIPSREFLISFFVLFVIVCLFFSSSRSLLNVSCIFSILFLRFWIIFTLITLNSFSGRLLFPLHLFVLVGFYLAPSSAAYFSVFSFCLTYCVWGLLFAGCRFLVPVIFGV